MNQTERKAQLTEMTNGLRCRCPGSQVMTRVKCKNLGGARYCYFACADAEGSEREFRYPVGSFPECRCSLGTQLDGENVLETVTDDEATWGFSPCMQLSADNPLTSGGNKKKTTGSLWPMAIGLGALLWYTTTQGRA